MLESIKRYIGTVVGLLLAAKELIELFEVPKHGEAKKEAVLDAIGILVDLADDFFSWLPKEKILSVADTAIDLWVRFKNLTNSWGKTDVNAVVGNS